MLFEKMRLAKKPFNKTVSFRKKHWYVFPQRWTWKKSVCEMSYIGNGVDAYKHTFFWLTFRYQFSWLFIDIVWELKLDREGMGEEIKRHESLKYTTDAGELFNH
jgi:hypothetical protein